MGMSESCGFGLNELTKTRAKSRKLIAIGVICIVFS
jgi:hypothetical protein